MLMGRQYIQRVLLYTGAYSLLAIIVVSLYLSGLLKLSSDQWWGFAQIVAGTFVLIFPGMLLAHRKIFASIQRSLDGLDRGEASPEELSRGFAAVADFPRYWFVWGLLWWAVGGAAVGLGMWLRYPEIGRLPPVILFTATISAAFITDTYYFLTIKRVLRPARVALAQAIGDVDTRAALIRSVSLRTKLLSTMTSVILVTVIFAGFLARVRTERAVATQVESSQAAALETFARGGLDFASARELAADLGVGELVLLDPDGTSVDRGADTLLPSEAFDEIRRSGQTRGSSLELSPGFVLSWTRLEADAGVLVLVLDAESLDSAVGAPWRFALLLVFSTLVAMGAAYLLARDLGDATDILRREATRVASGDLLPGQPFDAEDEMGDLAHSFERMATSLRSAVSGVADAAERMNLAAGEIASASGNVAEVTASTVEDVAKAASSMTEIDGRVRGIADSTESLSTDVHEATSAVNELEAAGGELSRGADVLSRSVHEVAGSIEQMASSISQVSHNSDAVAEATGEASASMDETSTAAHQVEATASQVADLAERMVALSESGQERVKETVRDTEMIREATQSAHAVISELGRSTREIGTVVSVIDDVVAETNLLALNAAIIAAQAGEHGRGFAVVAGQVKQLSNEVLVRTKEIGGLVERVQTQSQDADRAIERGASLVQQGVERSRDAGDSLEAITGAARETGDRLTEIVGAVTEQSRAVAFAADLMGRVRGGSEEIHEALREQTRNTGVLRQSSGSVQEVFEQLQHTASDHAQSTEGIGRNMENVRDSLARINEALHEQSWACRDVVDRLRKVDGSTRSNEESVRRLDDAMHGLERMAAELNQAIARFRI